MELSDLVAVIEAMGSFEVFKHHEGNAWTARAATVTTHALSPQDAVDGLMDALLNILDEKSEKAKENARLFEAAVAAVARADTRPTQVADGCDVVPTQHVLVVRDVSGEKIATFDGSCTATWRASGPYSHVLHIEDAHLNPVCTFAQHAPGTVSVAHEDIQP